MKPTNHQSGETYNPQPPFLPNHWSFFTRHLILETEKKIPFVSLISLGGPILTSPSTWLHQSLWRNLSNNATMRFWDIPKSHQHPIPCLLHFALVFWIRNLYTLYAAQSIIHQQKWSGIVVGFPTKPPRIKVKPTEIARKADVIACYGKSTQTTHIFAFVGYGISQTLESKPKKWLPTEWQDFLLKHPNSCVDQHPPAPGGTLGRSNLEQTESPRFKTRHQIKDWLITMITWAWKKRGGCIIIHITVDWQIGLFLVWDACVKTYVQ